MTGWSTIPQGIAFPSKGGRVGVCDCLGDRRLEGDFAGQGRWFHDPFVITGPHRSLDLPNSTTGRPAFLGANLSPGRPENP